MDLSLDEGLITLQQIGTLYANYIPYVVSYYGRMALSKGLITFEQMRNMPTEHHLKLTLTKAVLDEVEKEIITVEQIYSIPSKLYMLAILTSQGLYAIQCMYVTF